MKGIKEEHSDSSSAVCYMKTGERVVPVPELLTESELIDFLRIPEVSSAKDHRNVINNLVRFRNLPRIHICKRRLYPKTAIIEWLNNEVHKN